MEWALRPHIGFSGVLAPKALLFSYQQWWVISAAKIIKPHVL
jgi:hypothetical protein